MMSDSHTLVSGLAYLAVVGLLVYLPLTAPTFVSALIRAAILAVIVIPVSIMLSPDTLAPTHAFGRFLAFLLAASLVFAVKRLILIIGRKLSGSRPMSS
jgi:hypothetical protein